MRGATRRRGACWLLGLLLFACQQPAPAPVPSPPSPTPASPEPPSPSPSPVPWPVIVAMIAEPNKVAKDETVRFNVVIANPRSVPLTYRWRATGGSLSGADTRVARWSPLDANGQVKPGTVTVTLEVSDGLYRVVASTPFEIAPDGAAMQSGTTRLPDAREQPPFVTP